MTTKLKTSESPQIQETSVQACETHPVRTPEMFMIEYREHCGNAGNKQELPTIPNAQAHPLP